MVKLLIYYGFLHLVLTQLSKTLTTGRGKNSISILTRKDINLGRRSSLEHIHEAVVCIKLNNLDKLRIIVKDISNPSSSKYGQHLTRQQLGSMTSNFQSLEVVSDFFESRRFVVYKRTRYGEYLFVRGSIQKWESLLQTTFYEVHTSEIMKSRNNIIHRALSYTMPAELSSHVEAIFNINQIPPKNKITRYRTSQSNTVPIISFGSVTPQLLNEYYNIPSNFGNNLTSQSLYEAIKQNYSPTDLTSFQKNFNITIESIVYDYGGYNYSLTCEESGDDCGEANLDVQYMMAVAQKVPTIYFYDNSTDFLLTWSTTVLNMDVPPIVNSISYGAQEYEFDQDYIDIFEMSALLLSALGCTIVASSGDDGAPGSDARYSNTYCSYSPQWPVTSPFVLAVGATQGPESDSPEIACSSNTGGVITTGGGFSNLYPMPDWQFTDVKFGYLKQIESSTNGPYPGFNTTGRGYPDISVLGHKYNVLIGGMWYYESGTSASAPVLGAMISLINSERRRIKKSNLGWINPALYQLHSQFERDITSGDNNCCAGHNMSTIVCCHEGFNSVAGWDPVTGFGSMDFVQFYNTFVALNNTNAGTHQPTVVPSNSPTAPTVPPTEQQSHDDSSSAIMIVIVVGASAGITLLGTFFYYVLVKDALALKYLKVGSGQEMSVQSSLIIKDNA